MSDSIEPKFATPFTFNADAIVVKNWSRLDLAGIRLANQVADYLAGSVLALNSVSALYQMYDPDGASGTNTAVCVLLHTIRNINAGENPAAVGIFHGELFNTKCLDLDGNATGNAISGARTYTDIDGLVVLTF